MRTKHAVTRTNATTSSHRLPAWILGALCSLLRGAPKKCCRKISHSRKPTTAWRSNGHLMRARPKPEEVQVFWQPTQFAQTSRLAGPWTVETLGTR